MGKEWYWSRSISREEKGGHGCMSGMLYFLKFHQLLFSAAAAATPATKYDGKTVPQSSPLHPSTPTNLKGFEAPRNSLELNEPTQVVKGEYFDVPVGIQINPTLSSSSTGKKREKKAHLLEEERRSSPTGTPTTPGLVARLMGLEVLPEQASRPVFYSLRSTPKCRSPPTPAVGDNKLSQRKTKNKNKKDYSNEEAKEMHHPRKPLQGRNCNITGSHSLPETPRSSSARRSWDVDPRLSLQLNKENKNPDFGYLSKVSEDYPLPSSPVALMAKLPSEASWRHQNENKSPRIQVHYAREVVKQVKESISKRRSNTASADNGDCTASKLKGGKPSQSKALHENAVSPRPSKSSTTSFSPPRNSFSDASVTTSDPSAKSRLRLKPTRPPPPPPPLPPEHSRAETMASTEAGKCKKVGYERYTRSIKKNAPPASRLEAAVTAAIPLQTKKCSSIPSLSFTNSRSPPRAAQLNQVSRPSSMLSSRTEAQELELEYVRSVLEHANPLTAPPTTLRWYSPSHPIDPVIFHRLELRHPPGEDSLRQRSNRRLLFHLVDEIIGDISQCPRLLTTHCDGEALLQRVWSQIQSYPSTDCKVIGDIDALVEGDLPARNVRRLLQHPAVAEEAADLTAEIERGILDSILREMR